MKDDKMLGFVVDIEENDFERYRRFACIYCGDTTQKTRDHVISVSWSGHKRSYAKGDTVPSCKECNSMLRDIPIHSISGRASYIANKLEQKYRKYLKFIYWSAQDLKDMSPRFKFIIKAAGSLKSYIQQRITHAVLMSLDSHKSLNVRQQTIDDCLIYDVLTRCFHGEKYFDVEKSLNLTEGQIRKIIKNKQYASLVIAFKYENGIPFDFSLSKVFKLKQKEQK